MRNKIKVNVNIENKVDFTVAQGQYQAIVHLIQQNFPEIQCSVLDLFVLPVPKFVHLKVWFLNILFNCFFNFCAEFFSQNFFSDFSSPFVYFCLTKNCNFFDIFCWILIKTSIILIFMLVFIFHIFYVAAYYYFHTFFVFIN